MTARLLEAHKRGYRVREDGLVETPHGGTLRGWSAKNGYRAISLRIEGKPKWIHVHSLAAFQKFGKKALAEGTQVRHLNGLPHDNRLVNIAIGSARDNRLDLPKTVRVRTARSGASAQRKLSPQQIKQLKKDRAAGAKYKDLTVKYGITKSTVSYILNGKTYGQVVE